MVQLVKPRECLQADVGVMSILQYDKSMQSFWPSQHIWASAADLCGPTGWLIHGNLQLLASVGWTCDVLCHRRQIITYIHRGQRARKSIYHASSQDDQEEHGCKSYCPVAHTSIVMKCFEMLDMAWINSCFRNYLDPIQFPITPQINSKC